MTARLERAIERPTTGAAARFSECANLGVRLTGAFMMSLAHDDAIGRHHDRSDERVRARASASARSMKQCAVHEGAIGRAETIADLAALHHFSSNRPST